MHLIQNIPTEKYVLQFHQSLRFGNGTYNINYNQNCVFFIPIVRVYRLWRFRGLASLKYQQDMAAM